jgi:hypothetical protein
MSKMSELHLEMSKAVQPLPLDEYRGTIQTYLDKIEGGAEMVARRTRQLLALPEFDTRAEYEVASAERVLEKALQRIRTARAELANKPRESSHAS